MSEGALRGGSVWESDAGERVRVIFARGTKGGRHGLPATFVGYVLDSDKNRGGVMHGEDFRERFPRWVRGRSGVEP